MKSQSFNESSAAPRGEARHVLRDAIALAELQGRLIVVDVKECLQKSKFALVLVAGGAALAAACIPVGLAALALLLTQATSVSPGQAFLIVFGGAATAAAACLYGGWRVFAKRRGCLDRSRLEWRQNLQWIKDTLKHPGEAEHESCDSWLHEDRH